MALALPSMGAMMVGNLTTVFELYFIGKSDNIKLISGVGLGIMINNLFGTITFIGMNGAIETLVP